MIQHFDEIGIIQGTQRLPHFVMINQNDAVAGRVQGIPLAANAHVASFVVYHPKFGAFFV